MGRRRGGRRRKGSLTVVNDDKHGQEGTGPDSTLASLPEKLNNLAPVDTPPITGLCSPLKLHRVRSILDCRHRGRRRLLWATKETVPHEENLGDKVDRQIHRERVLKDKAEAGDKVREAVRVVRVDCRAERATISQVGVASGKEKIA